MSDRDDPFRSRVQTARWTFDADETIPDPDDLYRALEKRERRHALYCLEDGESRSCDELATLVAGWRSNREGIIGPNRQRQIAARLHHVHLPLLDELDLVDYDADNAETRLEPLAEPVKELISFARKYDRAVAAAEHR